MKFSYVVSMLVLVVVVQTMQAPCFPWSPPPSAVNDSRELSTAINNRPENHPVIVPYNKKMFLLTWLKEQRDIKDEERIPVDSGLLEKQQVQDQNPIKHEEVVAASAAGQVYRIEMADGFFVEKAIPELDELLNRLDKQFKK